MRMPPEMFDEVLERIRHRITKQFTFYRDPLEPGLKLAIALRHLASGSKYSDMKFGWRVPPNTISIVREVCKAIVEEYLDEVMTPHTTPDEWRRIADQFVARWNFPHTCGALDGKHAACRCPHKSGSTYYNYKGFYSIVMMGLVDVDYRFIWAMLEVRIRPQNNIVEFISAIVLCVYQFTNSIHVHAILVFIEENIFQNVVMKNVGHLVSVSVSWYRVLCTRQA